MFVERQAMSFLKDLKSVVRNDDNPATAKAEISKDNPLFVYVRMPVDLGPNGPA